MSTNDFYWDSEIGQWVHAVKRSVVSPTPSAGQHTSTPAITEEQKQTMLALCYQLAAEHERLRLRGTWSESLADQTTSQRLAEHMRAKYGEPASDNKKDREDSNRDAARRFAKILKKRTGEGQPKKADVEGVLVGNQRERHLTERLAEAMQKRMKQN